MNYNSHNNMLSGYQRSNLPFQNNPLLMNNPQYVNMINERQSPLNQDISKYKHIQEMKKQQKYGDLDKSLVHESVIRPINVTRENKKDFIDKFNKLDSQWDNMKKNAWETRTNQPYKNILKGEKYDKFINRKNIEKEELVVHRVTDADKEGFREAVQELENSKEKHNNELKVIYSASEETKHKKQFEYNHRDKYKVKYDPKNFDELKKDQYDYYKKEQEKIEKDKNNVMDILDNLLNSGMLDKEEIEKIEKEEEKIDSTPIPNNMRKYAEQKKMNPKPSKEMDNTVEIKPAQKDIENKSNKNNLESKKNVESKLDQKHGVPNDLDDLKKKYMDRQKKK